MQQQSGMWCFLPSISGKGASRSFPENSMEHWLPKNTPSIKSSMNASIRNSSPVCCVVDIISGRSALLQQDTLIGDGRNRRISKHSKYIFQRIGKSR